MKYNEIKKFLKKDPPGSAWIWFHRKVGVVLTYVIYNINPNINPNVVTLTMLPLNILSALLVMFSIINSSLIYLLISFLIFSFSLTLDCVDGNLARLTKKTSYKGIYYDRIVHNLSHPLFILLLGYAVSFRIDSMMVFLLFAIAAIVSEFSPLEVSVNDVKISFVNQILFKKSKNFDLSKHIVKRQEINEHEDLRSIKPIEMMFGISIKLAKFILSFEFLYVLLMIEYFVATEYLIIIIYFIVFGLVHFAKGFYSNDLNKFLLKLSKIVEGGSNEKI